MEQVNGEWMNFFAFQNKVSIYFSCLVVVKLQKCSTNYPSVWGWIDSDCIFIFGWPVPLMFCRLNCQSMYTFCCAHKHEFTCVPVRICGPSPRCTGHWTPPPGPWGSSSRRWSGNEPRHSWRTGWCVPRSSPHPWCPPAARCPPPGGTLGSHWHHGSRWLQAPKLLCLQKPKTKHKHTDYYVFHIKWFLSTQHLLNENLYQSAFVKAHSHLSVR